MDETTPKRRFLTFIHQAEEGINSNETMMPLMAHVKLFW